MHFEHYRLPELFAGFRREDYKVPVRYPVACHPQAWAAVTVPYLIETLLGFAPEAFENRLRIIRPILKLQEIRSARAQSWEDMKTGIAAAAEDLAQAYDDDCLTSSRKQHQRSR